MDLQEKRNGANFNNWGWTNGPFFPGNYTLELYSGAADCDINKGTIIGNVTVEYDGDKVTIIYTIDVSGEPSSFMTSVHVYAGEDILPKHKGRFTTAPGRYPVGQILNNETTFTVVIDIVDGEAIFVIAHTIACVFPQI